MDAILKGLYEKRKELLDEAQTLVDNAKRTNKGVLTAEERTRFNAIDKELDEISPSIDIQLRAEADILRHKAVNSKKLSHGIEQEGNEENFRTSTGKELPVFSKSNRLTVRSYYENENQVDESLKGMTFGRLLRAHLFGARNEQEERALSEGTPSAGGYTVPEIIGADFVDRLRPKSRVLQAGANLITIDEKTNKYSLAKLVNGMTVEWKAENAQQTPADVSFGQVAWEFKTLRAMVVLSNELLQDSINIDRVINAEAARAFATEFDRVALVGLGTGSEPEGIANYTSAQTVSMTTNGAAPDNYDEIIALIQELQAGNADVDGSTPAIMHPRTLAAYNVLKSSVDDQPLRRPQYIDTMPFYHTTSVPITDTYGSSSVASKLFIGDWSQLYFGMRLGVTILPLKERYADYNQTGFLIAARMDVKPLHEASFGYIKGLLGASLPS